MRSVEKRDAPNDLAHVCPLPDLAALVLGVHPKFKYILLSSASAWLPGAAPFWPVDFVAFVDKK